MKNQWKGFICGMLVTLLLIGSIGTAAATVGSQTAELHYNTLTVTLDGEPVKLVDANGSPVEPFIIGGTTYLPIRAISNAFGLDVDWDGATQTVNLTPPTQNPPPDQTEPELGRTIYMTPTGKRYQYDSSCNGGTYIPSTLGEALKLGLTPCDKCVH